MWFELVTFRSLSSPEPLSLSLSVTRSLHLRSMELLGYGSSEEEERHWYNKVSQSTSVFNCSCTFKHFVFNIPFLCVFMSSILLFIASSTTKKDCH